MQSKRSRLKYTSAGKLDGILLFVTANNSIKKEERLKLSVLKIIQSVENTVYFYNERFSGSKIKRDKGEEFKLLTEVEMIIQLVCIN